MAGSWILRPVQEGAQEEGRAPITLVLNLEDGRLAGTAVGSAMPFLWVYDTGSLDEAGTTATLECDGPKMDENGIPDPSGAMARYRDVHTVLSEDERTHARRKLFVERQCYVSAHRQSTDDCA